MRDERVKIVDDNEKFIASEAKDGFETDEEDEDAEGM